jgi:hypothetical protein
VGRGGNDTFGGAWLWAWLVCLFLLWGVLNIFVIFVMGGAKPIL